MIAFSGCFRQHFIEMLYLILSRTVGNTMTRTCTRWRVLCYFALIAAATIFPVPWQVHPKAGDSCYFEGQFDGWTRIEPGTYCSRVCANDYDIWSNACYTGKYVELLSACGGCYECKSGKVQARFIKFACDMAHIGPE